MSAVVTGVLFFLFLPFAPLVGMVPKEATSGALIAIGVMMCGVLVNPEERIDLSDPEQAWPIVTTFITMPLTYSITNGIGAGILVYTLVRLTRGQRDSALIYLTAAAFLVYFLRHLLGSAG